MEKNDTPENAAFDFEADAQRFVSRCSGHGSNNPNKYVEKGVINADGNALANDFRLTDAEIEAEKERAKQWAKGVGVTHDIHGLKL